MSPRARLTLLVLLLGGLALFLVVLRLGRGAGGGGRLSRLFSRAEPEPEAAPAVTVESPAIVEPVPTPTQPWDVPFAWSQAALVEGNRGEPFEIGEEKAGRLLAGPLEMAIVDDPAAHAFHFESLETVREAARASGEDLGLLSFAFPLSDSVTHSVLLGCNPCPVGKSVVPTVLTRGGNEIKRGSSSLFKSGFHVVNHVGDLNRDGAVDVVLATGDRSDAETVVLWGQEGTIHFAVIGNAARLWREGERTILEGRTWAGRPDLGDARPAWPTLYEWDGQTFSDRRGHHPDFYRLHFIPEQERALAVWAARTDADEPTRKRWIAVHLGLLERARAFLEDQPLASLESLDRDALRPEEPAPADPTPTPEAEPTPSPFPERTATPAPAPALDLRSPSPCGVPLSPAVGGAWRVFGGEHGRLSSPKGPEQDAGPSRFETTGRYLEFPVGEGLSHGAIVWARREAKRRSSLQRGSSATRTRRTPTLRTALSGAATCPKRAWRRAGPTSGASMPDGTGSSP